VTATESNPYPRIKAYEQQEMTRLREYLEGLDADGWIEQSYCTDWLVYQVVSHISSGAHIGGMRLRSWLGVGEPVGREQMQQIWAHFDALAPTDMFAAFREAADEYLAVESETADEGGLQEVEGFAGKRPLWAYQLSRVWELACHSWDVYVARDRGAQLDADAVALLAANLQYVSLPLDRERAAALSVKPIAFELAHAGTRYVLDPTAERPRLAADGGGEAGLVVTGPDEEVVRFISGRGYVPGSQMLLEVKRGSAQDLANLRRAFR
jgi:uncharacterized protein (TIGR03083 family)